MPTIPELLDETEKNLKGLVSEVQAYKSARELNEESVKSLDKISNILVKIADLIKPLTSQYIRVFLMLISAIVAFDTLLLLVILVLLIIK